MAVFDFITNTILSIQNGLVAADETRKVVFKDRVLFIYPIAAVIIGMILVIAAFLGYVQITRTIVQAGLFAHSTTTAAAAPTNTYATFAFLFVFFGSLYLVFAYTTTYFLMAMLLAFREFTKGSKVGLLGGLGMARQYAGLILEWVLFIFIIKVIIDAVELAIILLVSRFLGPRALVLGTIVSRRITGIASIGLSIATLFAMPIILDEKTGPVKTVRSSVSFIVKNWGETLGGFAYSEIIQVVLTAMAMLLFAAAWFQILASVLLYHSTGSSALGASLMVIAFVIGALIMFYLVRSVLGTVFLTLFTLLFSAAGGALVSIAAIIALLAVVFGHLLQYVLFNCFRLIVYDYKTRKVLPQGFDRKAIDTSVYYKGAAPGAQVAKPPKQPKPKPSADPFAQPS